MMSPTRYNYSSKGFTLAELLIALTILGVIATLTIPKVLQTTQDGRFNAIAKETMASVSQAYQTYSRNNAVTGSNGAADFTSLMNYVKVDSTSLVDNYQGLTTADCSTSICLKLHNGAILYTYVTTFAGTASTNAVYYYLDPDGKVTDGTTNGPGKAMVFFLYYNGRITDYSGISAGTTSSFGLHTACPACMPPWFSW